MNGRDDARLTPTVFVVDEDPAARRAITWRLESAGRGVENFVSGEAFLQAYRPDRSGCLILDLRRPGIPGLVLQEGLTRRRIGLPVIMLTGYGEVTVAVEALQRGAIDFIEKPVDDARLQRCIDTAFALDAERRRRECLRHDCASRIERLTRREREVMAMVVEGKANKVVAYELGISEKTVESHRARLTDALEQHEVVDRLLDEIDGATLENAHRRVDVGEPGDHDDRQFDPDALELFLEDHTAHSRQADVEHQTTGLVGSAGGEEPLGGRERLGGETCRLQQPGERLAHGRVVVNDEHLGSKRGALSVVHGAPSVASGA